MQRPSEDEIISLLENMQPQPGAHLRTRVANATWARPTPEQRRPLRAGGVSLRRTVFVTLAVIGVSILFFAIPPFNGVARRVTDFFYHTDQNTIPIAVQSPSREFDLTVAEAAAQAGYAIQQPGWVPEGFLLNGAAYDADRQSALLDYHSPIPGKFLRLSQNLTAENRLDLNNIGPGADVQTIPIHTSTGEIVSGEYVAGAWRIPSVFDHLQTGQPDMTATMQVNWDPEAKIHMLRWETGGFLYEIIHADPHLDSLSADLLVKIAESMK